MKIGIIGAGGIGLAFAKHVAAAGYELILSNSRGPASLSDTVKQLGGKVKAGTVQDAAEADIVFVSLQWQQLQEVLPSLNWHGQIIIDATNPILPGFKPAELPITSSEQVAEWAKGAIVVKAFNTLKTATLAADPNTNGGNRMIFFAGDDANAKGKVAELIERMGFAGIDLGALREGGKMSQFPGGPLAGLELVKTV